MSKRPTGKNTVAGKELLALIERIELVREQKKALADDEKLIFAEAKSLGFDTKTMRNLIKRRDTDQHVWQETQDMLDMYMHAVGMEADAPLFRSVGLMSVDTAARDQVIAALAQLVPQNGEIIVKAGGVPVRLFRDKDGNPVVEDHNETPAAPPPSEPSTTTKTPAKRAPKPPVPDVSPSVAFELGSEAFRKGKSITSNPFPAKDKRRPRFDAGWRDASGTDGMGEDNDT